MALNRCTISKCIAISLALGTAGLAPAVCAAMPTANTNPAQVSYTTVSGNGQVPSPNVNEQRHKKKGNGRTHTQRLQGVVVTGVVQSKEHSIQIKRDAADIQDSITALNIGQLPDVTIANSMARIPGVQINRQAGEGTTIQVNGLPEVSTLLNGAPFIGPDNIDSIQPNYEALPSGLFSGVDVYKSSQSRFYNSGISGTVNLKTKQPWDLPFGLTFAGTEQVERGSAAKKTKPDLNALVGYNANGRWGVLLGISYSDEVHEFDTQGFNQGIAGYVNGENATSTHRQGEGWISAWGGSTFPPPGMTLLPGGNVDVNGDGKSNGAFYLPNRFNPVNETFQPKRLGITSAFQFAFGGGLTLTADSFFIKQDEYEDSVGLESLPATGSTPNFLPTATTETAAVFHNRSNAPNSQVGDWNQNFFTTQAYNQYYGDYLSNTQGGLTRSLARNSSVELKFDNGGALTGSLRYINASASQLNNFVSFEVSTSNGSAWPHALKPGVSLPSTVFVRPSDLGGNFVYNPQGFVPWSFATGINWQGKNPVVTNPANVTSALRQKSQYAYKGLWGDGYKQRAGMNIVSLRGKYVSDGDFSVNFGLTNSIRSASDDVFNLGVRVYGGDGASDPSGCMVRYVESDGEVDGGGVAGACTAGNQEGFYRANPLAGPLAGTPAQISDHLVKVVNPADTQGVFLWALSPSQLRHPKRFVQTLYGNVEDQRNPPASWNVQFIQRSAFAQLNFGGDIDGHTLRGNFGARFVRSWLNVTQFSAGNPEPYGLSPEAGPTVYTHQIFTDILPAFNLALNITPKLILRLSGSKNMMPLTLDQWGGGFSPGYTITGTGVEAITGASATGNPKLKPWRSTNYSASLEYYINKSSILDFELYRIDVASFVDTSSSINCNLPDQDGVIRHRCVPVTEPEQGAGQLLHGAEVNYQQSLSFLPSFLSHTGFDINATYSPSNTGKKDLAGNEIPFPGNSEYSGNAEVWYEDSRLQVRAGLNYRSKQAVSSNYAGVSGFELYEAPEKFIDASVSYKVNRHLSVFLQGTNLTNTRQKFYLVWPDEKITNDLSERAYFFGVHVKF